MPDDIKLDPDGVDSEALLNQIDALLSLAERNALTPPLPGIPRELLEKSAYAIVKFRTLVEGERKRGYFAGSQIAIGIELELAEKDATIERMTRERDEARETAKYNAGCADFHDANALRNMHARQAAEARATALEEMLKIAANGLEAAHAYIQISLYRPDVSAEVAGYVQRLVAAQNALAQREPK